MVCNYSLFSLFFHLFARGGFLPFLLRLKKMIATFVHRLLTP